LGAMSSTTLEVESWLLGAMPVGLCGPRAGSARRWTCATRTHLVPLC
jgi:hypothetical protein